MAKRVWAIAVAVLLALNLANHFWLVDDLKPLEVPVFVAVGLGLLVMARRGETSLEELGLGRDKMWKGFMWGALIAGVIVAAAFVCSLAPITRDGWLANGDSDQSVGSMLFHILVRIPIVVALFEEFAFRGLLLGVGSKVWSPKTGGYFSAVLFGLWHIYSSSGFGEVDAGGPLEFDKVALIVGATFVFGLVLNWLRDQTEGILAGMMAHFAANASFFYAAWMLAQ